MLNPPKSKVEEEETVDVEYTCGSMVWTNYLFVFLFDFLLLQQSIATSSGVGQAQGLPSLAWHGRLLP